MQKLFTRFILFFFKKVLSTFFGFLFNRLIVKAYSFYLSSTNKIGWSKIRGDFVNFIFGQKLVHVVMVLITFIFVFTNLAESTRAGILNDASPKPIITKVIGSEFGELEESDIYVEEAFSPEELDSRLTLNYMGRGASLKNELKLDYDSEEDESGLNPVLTETSETSPQAAQARLVSDPEKRTEIVKYVVESGDTVSTIARKFGVSVNTILWENDLNSRSLIRPGDELDILPQSGISYEIESGDTLGDIARRMDVEIDEILKANDMSVNSKLRIGQKLMIPGASKSSGQSTQSQVAVEKTYTGIQAIKNIVKPEPVKAATNKMAWPTVGNRITQYYSWRHKGLDIANKTGTPLFASDSGEVEFASWSNGYGYNVIIDHGGGKKTRYAHMSRFYVEVGDDVTKGEAIGEMGSTGWSTGPHIHFEVIIGGVKYNPLNYIR